MDTKITAAIVDDEQGNRENLLRMIGNYCPQIRISAICSSVTEARTVLPEAKPDILFLDIRLGDDTGFSLLGSLPEIPFEVIFVTAYDSYAIQAIRFSALDYLLKPIGKEDIEHAFEKLDNLQDAIPENGSKRENKEEELLHLIHSLKKQENYKTHFLIPMKGDKLLPVSIDMIQLFYIKDCQVKAVLTDGMEYNFSLTLDELVDCLNPSLFFRVNRQFLISREAIKDIDLWFNSRLSINLRHSRMTEKILVSKARVAEFKEWFSSKK